MPLPAQLPLYSAYFQQLMMEQFEAFVDTFITNMPDTLRRFKLEEDDQRKKLRSGFPMDGVTEQAFHPVLNNNLDNKNKPPWILRNLQAVMKS